MPAPTKVKKAIEGHCTMCKDTTKMKNAERKTMKNNRGRYSGECSDCGNKMSVFASKEN